MKRSFSIHYALTVYLKKYILAMFILPNKKQLYTDQEIVKSCLVRYSTKYSWY